MLSDNPDGPRCDGFSTLFVGAMTLLPVASIRTSRWLLFATLGSLHLALWLGVASIWARPLLFFHLGLFLLWQPLWRGESPLRPGSMLLIVGASIVALWWLNWWLIAVWVSGLCALVGGRVFAFRGYWLRFLSLSVMAYLLMVLLMWIVPHLFAPSALPDTAFDLMTVVLPLLLAATLLLPVEAVQTETGQTEIRRDVDFVYSLLLFLLLMLLVLGTLSFMAIGHADYQEALLRTLFSMALVLFVLAWVWNPRFGFSGLQPLFSRYLLNVGTPFESWLRQLADTAQHEQNPADFLAQAASHLAALPWLSGIEWHAGENAGSLGLATPHFVQISEQGLRLTLFSRQNISPAMRAHIYLLAQLLSHFYQAKLREQRLREMARLQAIYETGARLTHDLKNMLQSLFALISIAQQNKEAAVPALQQQLPVLAQRIELTLAKLRAPQEEAEAAQLPLAVWWENLRQRHQHTGVSWQCKDGLPDLAVPGALFDCVADNLIDNAIAKRREQPNIAIRIALRTQPLSLTICDNGAAIPAQVAGQLLHTIVHSENGLGVGLYQAARWASQLGYHLILGDNRNGSVCFELKLTDDLKH